MEKICEVRRDALQQRQQTSVVGGFIVIISYDNIIFNTPTHNHRNQHFPMPKQSKQLVQQTEGSRTLSNR